MELALLPCSGEASNAIEDLLVEGMSAADILEMYPGVRDDFEVALVAMTIDASSLHLFRSHSEVIRNWS